MEKQVTTNEYAIYNDDCMRVLKELPDKSADFSVYSPPFAGLYNYSSDPRDFSNCETKDQFLEQYDFLIKEMARLTKPGRITAVHCTDVMNSKTEDLWDFPHEIIKLHNKYGFAYKNRITVWKEPLKVRMRTMVRSLMHKLIVEDSTLSFPAMPDYVLIFKRNGDNAVPVEHKTGLNYYAGEYPLLPDHIETYADEQIVRGIPVQNFSEISKAAFKKLCEKYEGHTDPKTNKMSHIIWQRYASSVWDDIRIDNVLEYPDKKTDDDEKHVHPLQLDVIDRLVTLYSNHGEVVLTPFMGVGSEVFSAVSLGRKGIGAELKETYFKQAIHNLKSAHTRFGDEKQMKLDV